MQYDAGKHILPMANPSSHLASSFDFTEVQGKKYTHKLHQAKFDRSLFGNYCIHVCVKFLLGTSHGEFVAKLSSFLS